MSSSSARTIKSFVQAPSTLARSHVLLSHSKIAHRARKQRPPTMSRVIQHLEDEHRFVYEHKGAIAYLDYEPKGAVMAITHTWVPPDLAGQGIAADQIGRASCRERV